MTPTEVTAKLRSYNLWRRGNMDGMPQPDPREIGEAIDAAVEMIERLEAAEKERDALRAKIAEMEKQEPYSYIYEYANPIDGSPVWRDVPGYWNAQYPRSSKPLYALPGAQPAPSFADAYQGAMEEVAIWKKRALEAEDLNRKFIAEINGPVHMGEPVQNVPSVPTALLVAVADLVAQMEIVARVGFVDTPDDKDSCAAFCVAEGTWLELMSCVESLAASLAAAPEDRL